MKYLFISTQRSGHHAILVWFASQHGKDFTHYNNCKIIKEPGTNKNCLVTSNRRYCNCCNFNKSLVNQRHHQLNQQRIIFNFENKSLDFVERSTQLTPINIGKHKKIIVLRDHYNTIASYIRNWSIKRLLKCEVIKRWKEYAKKILEIQNNCDNVSEDYDYILYNKWLKDINYRKGICKKYNLNFTDNHFSTVPRHGNGSSFSKFSLCKKDEYLTRYKNYSKNEEYLKLVKDPELVELTKLLFNFTINL
jgi:hypothetical protein